MKRLGALLLSVALVTGAWFVRDRLGDDGGAKSSTRPSDRTSTRIVCAEELADACARLDGVVVRREAPGVTADRLLGGKPLGADAWLVPRPWIDLVNAIRDSPLRSSQALATTSVVAVGREGAASDPACRATWSCLATRAAAGLRLGHDDLDSTGGLLAVTGLVTGHLDSADFATNDFDEPDFALWLRRVEEAAADRPTNQSAIPRIQTVGALDVAVGLSVEARKLRAGFEAATPAPPITVDVALAGDPSAIDAATLRRALTAAGWGPPDTAPRTPEGGVLATLRSHVKELSK